MPASDIFAVMAGRRSVKRFSPRPVEMDKVMQVIQAGGLAPSSGNIQNWSFLIITEEDKIRGMYEHTLNQEPFLTAPVAIIICGDVDYAHAMYGMRGKRLYTIQNCAAAVQNMLLAAYALDLGSIWIGAFDEDKVSAMFGIPAHRHRPQAIILLGYPDEEPQPKPVKPLPDLIHFNTFGNKVLRPHLIYFDWAEEWRLQAKKLGPRFTPLLGKKVEKKERVTMEETAAKPARERIPSPEQMKRRLRDMIDSLKKDEYKEK
jgi:nitroreductase